MDYHTQQIMQYRAKIRNQMKSTLFAPFETKTHKELSFLGSPLEKIAKQDKIPRKRSYDLQLFESPKKITEIFISENFFDLFEVSQKLGEGAHCVVRKCKQLVTGNFFAVKLFRNIDCQSANNLKTQYKILKSLNHSNIIEAKYLFINQKQQNAQLVMEYCEATQLRSFMETKKCLPEKTTVEIISQLLSTLYYIHDKGICHRDIKPQNILFDSIRVEIKLIDFQIAKIYKLKFQRSEMWTITGSLYYKAPQMFRGKYTQLVDIWAIGILTYQLLVGKLPFNSEYAQNVITKIQNEEPQYPQSLSNFAKDFIKRCLVKNPLKRMNAREALTTPFLLRCESRTSTKSGSKYERLNRSYQYALDSSLFEENQDQQFRFELQKCFADDEQSSNEYFNNDIGIRSILDNNNEMNE